DPVAPPSAQVRRGPWSDGGRQDRLSGNAARPALARGRRTAGALTQSLLTHVAPQLDPGARAAAFSRENTPRDRPLELAALRDPGPSGQGRGRHRDARR